MLVTLVYVTFPGVEDAKRLSEEAVRLKLAACTNIFPITSCYFWDNALQNDNEVVCLFKTTATAVLKLESFIVENHSYEVPCILKWQVQANDAYGQWIEDQVIKVDGLNQ